MWRSKRSSDVRSPGIRSTAASRPAPVVPDPTSSASDRGATSSSALPEKSVAPAPPLPLRRKSGRQPIVRRDARNSSRAQAKRGGGEALALLAKATGSCPPREGGRSSGSATAAVGRRAPHGRRTPASRRRRRPERRQVRCSASNSCRNRSSAIFGGALPWRSPSRGESRSGAGEDAIYASAFSLARWNSSSVRSPRSLRPSRSAMSSSGDGGAATESLRRPFAR